MVDFFRMLVCILRVMNKGFLVQLH